MAERQTEYVKVHTLSDRFEADVIADALQREGIPVLVRQFTETAYSNIFVSQKGWGWIMVPKELADQAREIMAELSEMKQDDVFREEEALPASSPPGDNPAQKLEQVSEQLVSLRIEPRLWFDLRQADPGEVAARAEVRFDPEKKAYVVPFFNTALSCRPETEEIQATAGQKDFSGDFSLVLSVLHYLLDAESKPPADIWVSEKDLPGGRLFFTAAHALPVDSLITAFDGRPDLLDAAARSLGGQRTDTAAVCYRFGVLPRIPFLLIFWERDEEFAPSCHLLFDETITAHLNSLDLVWALANVFIRALLAAAGLSPQKND